MFIVKNKSCCVSFAQVLNSKKSCTSSGKTSSLNGIFLLPNKAANDIVCEKEPAVTESFILNYRKDKYKITD